MIFLKITRKKQAKILLAFFKRFQTKKGGSYTAKGGKLHGRGGEATRQPLPDFGFYQRNPDGQFYKKNKKIKTFYAGSTFRECFRLKKIRAYKRKSLGSVDWCGNAGNLSFTGFLPQTLSFTGTTKRESITTAGTVQQLPRPQRNEQARPLVKFSRVNNFPNVYPHFTKRPSNRREGGTK